MSSAQGGGRRGGQRASGKAAGNKRASGKAAGNKRDGGKRDGGKREGNSRDTKRVRDARPAAPIADVGRSVRVSRVFQVPASAIFRAVNDPDKRGWAPDPLFRVVSLLAPRFIRLAFPDGSLVGIAVVRQGNARCSVSVEHSRIPEGWSEAQIRDRWDLALSALAEQIDTGWD